MDNIDSRTLPVEARNERCLRAVKMRLERVSVKETATQGELSPTVVIAALKAAIRVAGQQWWCTGPVGRRARAAGSAPSRSARCGA